MPARSGVIRTVDEAELGEESGRRQQPAPPPPPARARLRAPARSLIHARPPRPRLRRSGLRAAPSPAPPAGASPDRPRRHTAGWRRRDPRVPPEGHRRGRGGELHRESRAGGVLGGERKGVGRAVDPRDDELQGARRRSRARSLRSPCRHRAPAAPRARDQRERALDQDLGLGPRDQRAPVDRERQPAESPLAEHVLEWLAARSPARRARARRRALLRSAAGRTPCRARCARAPSPWRAGARRRAAVSRSLVQRGARSRGGARDRRCSARRCRASTPWIGVEPGWSPAPTSSRPRARAADPPPGSPP